MKTIQFNQEVRLTTNNGKKYDIVISDNFDSVIRFYRDGVGHHSNAEEKVFGIQHGTLVSGSGDNRPWAQEQIALNEDEIVIYREDRYQVKFVGDYSDAVKLEKVA